MFGFWKRRRAPQVFLLRTENSPWAKIVVVERPKWPWNYLIGPFRSEPDAEQAADYLNAERPECLVYDPDHRAFEPPDDLPPEDGEEEEELEDSDDGETWKHG